MRRFLLVSCLTGFFTLQVNASDTIYANISNEYNLIGFPYLSIKEVIGDKNKFEIVTLASKEILLIPKARLGERLDLTLVASTGYTQLVSLTIKDMAPQKIAVPVALPHTLLQVRQKTEAEKVQDFFRSIMANRVQLNPLKKQAKVQFINGQLRTQVIGTFAGTGMRGYLVNVKNISSRAVNITEEDFIGLLPYALKVHIPNPSLLAKAETQIIIATEI